MLVPTCQWRQQRTYVGITQNLISLLEVCEYLCSFFNAMWVLIRMVYELRVSGDFIVVSLDVLQASCRISALSVSGRMAGTCLDLVGCSFDVDLK